MAAGLPVVAYDVGEMAATLGEGGQLVRPGEPVAFAAAVIELLDSAALRRALGAAGHGRVRRLFDWDVLAEVALAAYGARQ
jgi:glycosyltransferase involved in cell wall biosynthesis